MQTHGAQDGIEGIGLVGQGLGLVGREYVALDVDFGVEGLVGVAVKEGGAGFGADEAADAGGAGAGGGGVGARVREGAGEVAGVGAEVKDGGEVAVDILEYVSALVPHLGREARLLGKSLRIWKVAGWEGRREKEGKANYHQALA